MSTAQSLSSSHTRASFNENPGTATGAHLTTTPKIRDPASQPGDDTDLGEVVHSDDDLLANLSDTDDSDMAKQIEAAAECESLIGSADGSDDGHLENEEQYIIQDAIQRKKSKPKRHSPASSERGAHRRGSFDWGDEPAMGDEAHFWNTLSPAGLHTKDATIGDEMFKPQKDFATSPEPSFSDFFDSSEERENTVTDNDDDEMLTTDEETSSASSSGSSISATSLSTPLIAHLTRHDQDDDDAAHLSEADMEGSLRSAIPLLVIEDLDGRLIYARAGDGEAVFGSDGEFEFAGESEDDTSSDDLSAGSHALPYGGYPLRPTPSNDTPASDHDLQGLETGDDGDTTDEFADEDMPYPRLLIGSIAPRGGRNARRAREIAARTRLSSPRASSRSAPSGHAAALPRPPSSLSHVLASAGYQEEGSGSSDPSRSVSAEPLRYDSASPHRGQAADFPKPEMGQFIPAYSKSVHRAVIDGSNPAPSPFTSRIALQRGFGKKRAPPKQGLSEDSLEHALSVSSRLKRKRIGVSHLHVPMLYKQGRSGGDRSVASSPEPLLSDMHGVMDLSDVLDENLLWEDASDEPGSDHESVSWLDNGATDNTPTSTAVRSQWSSGTPANRRAARTANTSDAVSGGASSSARAIDRWNRIPMGAFRNSQEQAASPMATAYATHASHPFLANKRSFLPNAGSSAAISRHRRSKSNSSRHDAPSLTESHMASPLHRTLVGSASPVSSSMPAPFHPSLSSLPSSNASSGRMRRSASINDHTVVGGNFLVSPLLLPVKHAGRTTSNVPGPSSHGRKVTKKEKRERQARREALKRQQSFDQTELQPGESMPATRRAYSDSGTPS